MIGKLIRPLSLLCLYTALHGQSSTVLEATGSASYFAKILANASSASIPFTVDAVSSVTVEVLEGTGCSTSLLSPAGTTYNLSGAVGQFSGVSYSTYSVPNSNAVRVMVTLASPQAGQWKLNFSTAAPASSNIGLVANCYFVNGPKTLASIPRSIILGKPAKGFILVVDGTQAIQATVTAAIAMTNDPGSVPQPLNVTFDGTKYVIDLSSVGAASDYVVTYSISGVGSTGQFSRNGAGPVTFLNPAAAYGGTFTTTYHLEYGDH